MSHEKPTRRTRRRTNQCVMPECEQGAWRANRYPVCPTHLFRIWHMLQNETHQFDPASLNEEGEGSFYYLPPGVDEWQPMTESEAVVQEWAKTASDLQKQRVKAGHVPGEIYVLDARDGTMKIGWSRDIGKRLRQYPPTFRLLFAVYGTRADERDLHRSLKGSLTAGREWYAVTPEVVRQLNVMIDAHNHGIRNGHSWPIPALDGVLPPFVTIEDWPHLTLLRDFWDDTDKWKKRPAPKSKSAVLRSR